MQLGVVIPFVLGKVGRAGIAVEYQNIPAHDAAVSALRHRQIFFCGKVDDLTAAIGVVAVGIAAVGKAALLQHQQAVLHRGVLLTVKGHHFVAVLVVQGAAPSAPASGVRPAAEPVIGFAGHGVLQKIHILAAGGLIQHPAAAQKGAAVAGVVIAVQDAQTAVFQTGSVVQGLAAGIGGDRCGGRSRFIGSGRQHRTAAAQRKAQPNAHCRAAQTGKRTFHRNTPLFRNKNGRFFRFNYNTKQPRFPLQENAAVDYRFMTGFQDAALARSASSIWPSCRRNATRNGSETKKVSTSAMGWQISTPKSS